MSLLDEILSAGSTPRGRYGGGANSTPATAPVSSALDPQIEALIQSLSQPEPVPEMAPPQRSSLGARIASAIADGLTAYAGGRGAGYPTAFTGRLLAEDRANADAYVQNRADIARSKRQGQRTGDELRLRQLLNKQEQGLEATRRQAELDLADKKVREARAYSEGRDALKRVQDLADEADKRQFQQQQQARAEAHDAAMARLHDQLRDDSPSKSRVKDQLKALGEAKAGINEIAGSLPKALQNFGGPDGIRTQVRRKIAELNLEPDTEKAAWAYYDNEVQNQLDAATGGPMRPGTGF